MNYRSKFIWVIFDTARYNRTQLFNVNAIAAINISLSSGSFQVYFKPFDFREVFDPEYIDLFFTIKFFPTVRILIYTYRRCIVKPYWITTLLTFDSLVRYSSLF